MTPDPNRTRIPPSHFSETASAGNRRPFPIAVTTFYTPNQKSTYGYDDISRMTSATNESGTVTFGFDNRNRTTSTTDVFGHTINYEYERTTSTNQKRLKFDGVMYATYNFDDAERLSNIVNSSDSTTISFGYDNEDKVISRTYPNGVTTSYQYFDNDLLKRITDTNSSTTLFDRQHLYNNARQISQIVEPNRSRTFGYDNVDRLTSVTDATHGNESYSFDDVGNRLTSHRSSTYGYQSGQFNRLTSTATGTYQFDGNGNTVQKSEGSNLWRYTWDYENRLGEASTRRQKVRYKYDALGRRVQRFVVGNKENTKFIHDGLDVLVDDDAGTLTKYLDGGGIDNKLRVQKGTSANYFLADHLGSTSGLTDLSGAITSQTAYDSFGNQTAALATRYGYTGRERDDFSGLMHYRARFYDPNLGRFVSEDPIGLAGGINSFAYVHNNPLHFTDSLGLDAEWDQQVWRAQQDLINGMAGPIEFGIGFGDTTLFNGSRYFRQWQGIDDPSLDCSVAYQAGGWTAIAFQAAEGGVGFYRGGLALATGVAGPRVFWSGGLNTAGRAAAEYATTIGGSTLEMTAGGRFATRVETYLPGPLKRSVWDDLSASFARGTRGSADAFQNVNGVSLSSTWRRIEYGILTGNNVVIRYHPVFP